MPELCIMAEKGKQMQDMEKAFGGHNGTILGHSYVLCHSRGHLLTLVDPTKMVKPELRKRYASWSNMDYMPWNPNDFNWKKKYIDRSHHQVAKQIANAAKGCDGIVIATDDDPSGEGDLLGWEIVNAIGWKGPVYRIRPVDLSKKSLINSMKKISNVTDQKHQGKYLESEGRSRWDYLSMQETRIATYYARKAGFHVRVVNEGRLKSVIFRKIWKQLLAIKNYHKIPYYEVRYKDDLGNIYKRKPKKDEKPKYRFKSKDDGKKDLRLYDEEPLTNVHVTQKHQEPPKMLTLADLSTKMSKHGCYPKQFANLYEDMYMNSYVSYPRTADKGITHGQFNDLLKRADSIADLMGIDKSLLTHRTLRKKHYTAHAAHGANRPGMKVPKSWDELESKYGKFGVMIYKILAKSFLAILAEDYIYDKVSATPENHDDFKGSFNVPEKYNFKKILGIPKKDKEIDFDKWKQSTAKPFLYQGSNSRPTWPSQGWVINYLKKNNVGTGATQTGVLTQIVGHGKRVSKSVRILSKRGKYVLNRDGKISAIMAKNTFIGSTDITKRLDDIMSSVCEFKHTIGDIENMATLVVAHDKPIIAKNAKLLSKYIKNKGGNNMDNKKPKMTVSYQDSPTQVSASWGGHKFTEKEQKELSAGKSITFKGKYGPVTGKIGKGSFKDKKGNPVHYVGFIRKMPARYSGTFKGHKVSFKKVWSKHHITEDEAKKLLAGKTVNFKNCTSRKGTTYSVDVSLGKSSYLGGKIGIVPHFN